MKYRKILKGAGILLIVIMLLISNLSVIANKPIDLSKNDDQTNKPSIMNSSPLETFKIICEENFTDGNIPPEGKYGTWTNSSVGGISWQNCTIDPHSAPMCAVVRRGDNIIERDEWMITPSLDFSEIEIGKKIYLDFAFKGNYYTAIQKDYVDYFVNVSIDDGASWDSIWNEDNFTEEFTTKWAEVKDIDLSHYAGNSSVKIGFQFITYSPIESQAQYFYLDDISIHNETDFELPCSHGGPYEWWWYRQKFYFPEGVRFHADIDYPFWWWDCRWEWDFGDGEYLNTSAPLAIHFYENTSEPDSLYIITLKVTHIDLGIFRELNTTLLLFEQEPKRIDVTLDMFSVGVKAKIENLDDSNATYVKWKIEAEWGPFDTFHRVLGNGTIDNLEQFEPYNLTVPALFLKFGRIKLSITLIPDNLNNSAEIFRAFKIGPFLLFAREISPL
ncbi:MAG: hypothetical protein ACFFKA_17715 [Candidatus Thorarchaeota archaeon]